MEPQKEAKPNYLPYPPQSQSIDNEIDLRELFKVLWKGKWIIITTTFLFAIGAAFYALNLPNIYKADALLAPAESSNGGGLSKTAGQLGGLAALAGVNIGGADSSQTELAIQVLKSRQFIEKFINKHELLIPIMAVKGWDLETNKLIVNEDIYKPITDEWLREAKGLRGVKPTAQEAFEVFVDDILKVSQNKDTNLYTISIKYYSPYIAKQWVEWLIADINYVMRERAIKDSSQNLLYLNTQLRKTAISEMQSTFYKLIEEQTKSLMLAEVQEEFIFKVIDPPVVPEIKDEPRRSLICILGVMVGVIFGLILVFAYNSYNKLTS
ncbi:Wzz/FepE/Etk N-terminal domain-containing protein [Vibrio owensii]|uniref:Wzz/FepE/Etk N-terminal domain-containing protein n=1 Tax=Vibrio owensii TaxID=696485 RepID=UPI00221EDCBE|nr:Wzz/FepE/Etk N-terminal domain-containing protein [Vibrio owensii]